MYKTVIIYDKGEILNNVKEEFYKKFDESTENTANEGDNVVNTTVNE